MVASVSFKIPYGTRSPMDTPPHAYLQTSLSYGADTVVSVDKPPLSFHTASREHSATQCSPSTATPCNVNPSASCLSLSYVDSGPNGSCFSLLFLFRQSRTWSYPYCQKTRNDGVALFALLVAACGRFPPSSGVPLELVFSPVNGMERFIRSPKDCLAAYPYLALHCFARIHDALAMP